MDFVRSSIEEKNSPIWKFTRFDLNSRDFVIKGMWFFSDHQDVEAMKKSLAEVLNHYPQLCGRIENEEGVKLNNTGVRWLVREEYTRTIEEVLSKKDPYTLFGTGMNIKEVWEGKAALLDVSVSNLRKGSILSIECAHVCMDGDGFFTFLENWSRLHRGQPVETPVRQIPEVFWDTMPSSEQAKQKVIELGWKQVKMSDLLQFIWQKITGIQKIVSPPIHLSESQVDGLKQKVSGIAGKNVGTHAVLSAFAVKMGGSLGNLSDDAEVSQLSVMNLRSRIPEIDKSYAGNAVTVFPTKEFSMSLSLAEMAVIIQDTILSGIRSELDLKGYVLLNLAASAYKLPFTPFNLRGMNAARPNCFYVNNLLKFPVYSLDFGNGTPYQSLPNDLPDAFKLWPSPPDNPGVDMYLRGRLAKKYNQLGDKTGWLEKLYRNTLLEMDQD